MSNFKRNIKLLFFTPKEFLFAFTYSNRDLVHIKPFRSSTYKLGVSLINKICSKAPKLEVEFIGSTGLKIMGSGDIDIIIKCPKTDLKKYTPIIISLFGLPIKQRANFIEWGFTIKDIPVELCLIDPNCYEFKIRDAVYQALKNNNSRIKEYQNLMLQLNGLPKREYALRKLEYFNQLITK